MAFVETPRTGRGDNTTELAIDDMSPEKTWHSPKKRGNDLVNRMRNARGGDLRTPNGGYHSNSARNPLALRSNQQAAGTDEISLLLKSTSKPANRRGKENFGAPATPAVLKSGYQEAATPALDTGDSLLLGSEAGSYSYVDDGGTPVMPMPMSSPTGTPVVELPGKGGQNLLADQRNQMTLREQENVIDRIEKENFGLKLKIHYFEDLLRKADPDFNKTALKENVDLKVERMQLQRDVGKLRKQLKGSDAEMEKLRQRILELERRGDAHGRSSRETEVEITRLRQEYEEIQHAADELREELRKSRDHNPDVESLRGQIEDLESDLRQKDVELNDRDDKLDKMDEEISRLQTELDAKDTVEDQSDEVDELKVRVSELEDDNRNLRAQINSATETCHESCEQDREELRDKIEDLEKDKRYFQTRLDQDASKEDKITDLEADNRALQNELVQLKDSRQDKDDDELEELRERISDLEAEKRALENDLDLAKEARDDAQEQKQEVLNDLQELRTDMGDRSIHRKGFAEEVEQKARNLERDLRAAMSRHENAEQQLNQRTGEAKDLQTQLNLSREEARSREHSLKVKVKSYEEQIQQLSNQHSSSDERITSMRREIDGKVMERDTLQVRNDKIGQEIQTLRNEIARYKLSLEEVRHELEHERQLAADNEQALREEAHDQTSDLRASISDLRQRLESSQSELMAVQEKWQSDRRSLMSQKDQAEARADGLQESIYKLQSSRDDASGKELRLKDVLSNEEQRHRKEQNLLRGQIEQLESELRQKQSTLDLGRSDQLKLKENVRIGQDELANAERKIQSLEDEVQVLSNMVEDDQKRAEEKVQTARSETDAVKKQLLDVKQEKQRIQSDLRDVQDYTQRIPQTPAATRDAKLRLEQRVRDLEVQLERLRYEKDGLQTKLKRSEEDHAAAKRHTLELEQDLRQTLAAKSQGSPVSSLTSPVARREVEDMRKQVLEAQTQAEEARSKRKSTERELRGKLTESERSLHKQLRDSDQLRDDLEVRISDLELQVADHDSRRETAENTVQRLRTRISGLEKDLHKARTAKANDDTTTDERQQLERQLQSARLEVEEMQSDLAGAKAKVDAMKVREKQQKDLARRLQSERSTADIRHEKIVKEMQILQERHDKKRDKLAQQKRAFEEEKWSLQSQLTKPNPLKRQMGEADRRHQQELNGLAKQIQWLRAKAKREESFRAGLAFEKRFLLMNVDMYQSFNQLDLRLLEKMGITPDTQAPKKRPSLKVVAAMVLSTVRMKNCMKTWRESKKLKESLLLKAAAQTKALGKRKTAAA